MEDSVRQRVKEVVAYYNTTLSGCTDGDSAMQVKLSRQISHKGSITFDTLSFIHKTFPEVSTAWLMYGEGLMFEPENQDGIVDELQSVIADRDREIAHLNEMLNDKRTIIRSKEEKIEELKSLLHEAHEDYIEEKNKKEIV